MPVPDETNNFATHGKAPIPSNATGSFVVPRDKEVGPKDDDTQKPTTPPPIAAPPVAGAPSDTTSVGIAAPPSGAAFVSAPSPNTTMVPGIQPAPVLTVSPLAPPPMPQQIIPQQAGEMPQPMAMPQQMMPQMQQQMPMPMPMPQQIIPQQASDMSPKPIQQMSTEEMMRELQQMGIAQPMPQQIIPQQIIPQQAGEMPQPQPQPMAMPQQMMPQQMQQMPMPMPQQMMPQQMQQMPQQMPQMMPQMQQQMPMQMPQQMMPQQMQQMPQQMPQMMPQMQPAPMPPIQPIQPANSSPLTPSMIAEMQAEIMAKALLQSQQVGIRPRPKQTYQKDPEKESVYEEPTQEDIRDQKPPEHPPSNITHGERIILPIHDVTMEQHREDMSRRMTELLGDTDVEPEAISTKSMKKKEKELAKMRARGIDPENAGQQEQAELVEDPNAVTNPGQPTPAELFPEYTLSGEAIAPQAPLIDPLDNPKRVVVPQIQPQPALQTQIYTLETQLPPEQRMTAEQQQSYVEQEYRPQTPGSSRDITSQMQAAQIQTQLPEDVQSMDPRIAAIQQQQLMLAEQQKILEQQKLEAEAELAEKVAAEQRARAQQQNQPPHVQSNSGRLNPNRKPIRVNAEVVKKAALATILKRPTPPEPEPEKPIEAIRPAYVEELEQQLAGDMKKKEESEMSAMMAAELADDEITANAKQIKIETAKEDAKAAASTETMPDEILKAIENTAPVSAANPNIGSSPDPVDTLET